MTAPLDWLYVIGCMCGLCFLAASLVLGGMISRVKRHGDEIEILKDDVAAIQGAMVRSGLVDVGDVA